ncbi:DUF3923 family protein [Streptococcus chenjunshii]|uniref:DUF3923 family protein n=1 Tax=Streptococcus chenjunshii TaxID=2173853 RepID=A0A372KME5_9STRE|nr:DUF3923 family protein [Streptococcus chenjunshii]AXQ78177.1 DUF3923 family protein [Streptococcus chenjunshii]RFU50952.1 DUF3923 family protein [Streptococcus chenjunshii]RFU53449.1 DUF3923 family protein [Streptococcus chenjunshii]
MSKRQKWFIVLFNIILLAIFLDVSMLIFLRIVDSQGIFQTDERKWLTFLAWLLCYAFVWMCQGLAYLLHAYLKKLRKRTENA